MGSEVTERVADQEPTLGLQSIAQREALLLAPYAMYSADSRGRKHAEPAQEYRGPFQRDRDRILHCSAYRRLSGKMQVFTGEMGDYHRTRLTHTQEVASIARTIGRALRLNEDLVEALALLHDIGHPPFGHAGEDALNECLAEQGGFSHNRHALTIVEELESRYPSFCGLNLTYEVLEGQTARAEKSGGERGPLLEAQVVDAADSITYAAHDTDDAVKLGMVTLEELERIPLLKRISAAIRQRYSGLQGDLLRKAVVHELIDYQVTDVLRHSAQWLRQAKFANSDEARAADGRIDLSQEVSQQKRDLEAFLYERVYRHPQLIEVRKQAQARLRSMFQYFCDHTDELPLRHARRTERIGVARSVGDYLAGMTDRYCDQQFRRRLL